MRELIDRQAAIDAVVGWFCDLLCVESISADIGCIARLRDLPPVRTCFDCRYNHLAWSDEPCDSCTSGGESNHWKPSAQPEIVRCKDCLYYLGKKGCGHIDGMVTAEEDGFCSHAVRKGEQS